MIRCIIKGISDDEHQIFDLPLEILPHEHVFGIGDNFFIR